MSKFIDYLKDLAYNEAKKSPMYFKLGAIIFKGKNIISIGHNYDINKELLHGVYSIHAEVSAIINARNAKKDIKGADMLVVRLSKHLDDFRLAKPCKNCSKLIRLSQIKNVYYTYS